MKIGEHEIGTGRCFVIAEIGINHNGSPTTALDMIDAAKKVGADAVKFQKRCVAATYTEEELARPRESVFGSTNGDLKRGLELGIPAYRAIDQHCRNIGLPWFASVWDVESVLELAAAFPDLAAWKIPSARVTDRPLLTAVREWAPVPTPIIMSCGMSTLDDIDVATDILAPNLALLVCTAAYPAKPEDLNLRRIGRLRGLGFPVGWSGHEVGVATSVAAVALGAEIVERHFTLDRSMWGSDQSASMEPQGFRRMVDEIRTVEAALGSPHIGLLACEEEAAAKLRKVKL